MFRQNYTCSVLLNGLLYNLSIRDFHPLWSNFPECSCFIQETNGLIRVRSPLLAEYRLISFPLGTEMFQFPRFASHRYVFTIRFP